MKSDEFGDWTSKAKSARAEPSKSDGRLPDQPFDVDDIAPAADDIAPAIASADPDVE